MHMWLVSCRNIPRLINSFVLNGSFVRKYMLFSIARLKNKVYMHMWLVSCGSIPRSLLKIEVKRPVVMLFA